MICDAVDTSHSQSVASLEPGTSTNGKLPYIDPQRCRDREERAVAVCIYVFSSATRKFAALLSAYQPNM